MKKIIFLFIISMFACQTDVKEPTPSTCNALALLHQFQDECCPIACRAVSNRNQFAAACAKSICDRNECAFYSTSLGYLDSNVCLCDRQLKSP